MAFLYHPYKTIDDVKKAAKEFSLNKKEVKEKVYSRDNHIYFLMRVNKESVYALEKEIRKINDEHVNLQLKHPNYKITPKPIYLHLNTGGGGCQSGWAAVGFIKNSKIPVHTVIEGGCASAGTIMSVAGVKRYMTEHSRMLIHQLSASTWGTYEQLKDDMKYNDEDMVESIKYYADHSTMTKKEVKEQLKHDHWWDLQTALSKGLVDEEWKGEPST